LGPISLGFYARAWNPDWDPFACSSDSARMFDILTNQILK